MKDPRVNLAQVLEAARKIRDYTRKGRAHFLGDPLTQDAVIRNFQVIGEASKRIPADYRNEHPDLPWSGMAGFRNVLVHDYDSLDLAEIWRVIEKDVPVLIEKVEALLPPLEELERELAESVEDPNA
ncbi:MAG: DUF86 domain-containing protein [Chrysiogenetes bacterium]|nr:DUF86 domain-containing protein [Chrysiogenetes bacterium]